MRASPLSIGSIALNVVLLVALIVIGRSDDEAPRSSLSSPAAATADAKQDPAEPITIADEYWKPSPYRSAALRDAEYKSAVATRELLLKSFGPGARNQPAFVDVFQPLRQRFGFLSPDKQIVLQQILFETADDSFGFKGRDPQVRSERLTRIRALLDDKEFQEYQLRESPLAVRLANSGFDFTEAEFRAVYDAVSAAGTENARTDPLLTALPAIKQTLSSERFAEWERAQDPTYRWLRSGAARFGANQDTTVAAYKLIQDTDKRVQELKRTSADPARILQARAELIATRDGQLKTLLGEEMLNYIAPRLRASGKAGPQWAGDPAAAFIPAR